jgi:hypothetical protein
MIRTGSRLARLCACALAFGFIASTSSAFADEDFGWHYSSKGERAGTRKNDNLLTAECANGGILIVYAITKANLAPELAKKKRAYLMVVIDETDDGRGTFTSVNSNFIADEDGVRIGFGGRGALRLAHEMSEAKKNITVGVSVKDPTKSGSYTKHNMTRYEDLENGAAALAALFADCGVE